MKEGKNDVVFLPEGGRERVGGSLRESEGNRGCSVFQGGNVAARKKVSNQPSSSRPRIGDHIASMCGSVAGVVEAVGRWVTSRLPLSESAWDKWSLNWRYEPRMRDSWCTIHTCASVGGERC